MNRKIPLKELCIDDEWGKYGIPASAEEYDNNKTRYLRITDISEDGELLNNDKKSVSAPDIDKYLLKEGDIVFARTGNSTGKSYYHEDKNGKLAFAGFLIKYSLDKAKVNPKYVKFFTITNEYKNWVKNLSVGSTRGNINAQTFGDCPISVPERKQQDLLVRTLSLIIEKIELNNRINAELEAMAKTLYDYWFVQFDCPDKNGKPYKTSGGKMVWNEELKREIPEGWEVQKLKEFATTGSGGTPLSTKKEYYENGDIPWINSGELNSLYIIQTDNYITKNGLDNSSAKLFPSNTLLIALYGATAGKVSLLKLEAATNQAVCAILLKGQSYLNYLKFALSDLYQYLINLSTGSARDNLSQDLVKDLIFVIPPNNFIKQFNEIVNPSIEKIVSSIQENQKLTELRDWLLPMLMNGQVKVN